MKSSEFMTAEAEGILPIGVSKTRREMKATEAPPHQISASIPAAAPLAQVRER